MALLLLFAALHGGALSPATAADFDKGLAAYKAGDYQTALAEWRPLAEAGDVNAQTMLGLVYAEGKGVPQDDTEAVAWFRRAAEQGYGPAQNNLGFMYAKGHGVAQDDAVAVAWYRRAAEQGHAGAQFGLGLMYNDGRGVPQDNVAAQMWLNLAASKVGPATSKQHQIAVETWDQLASQMSHEAIIQAQALARRCLASNYQDCGD